MHTNAAVRDGTQSLRQGRHVEYIAQTLAIRFQQNWEARIARGHAQQIIGTLALLPQRRSPFSAPPRQQQGPARSFAKLRREQCRGPKLTLHQIGGLSRVEQKRIDLRRGVRLRKPQHEAVLTPHRLDVDTRSLNPRSGRHRPRRVHAAPERREAANAPVTEFIPHSLDHNRAIIRHLPRRKLLIGEIAQHILRRLLIEIMLAGQLGNSSTPRQFTQFANQRTDAPPELNWPPGLISVPERHLPRLSRRRTHKHTVLRDFIDTPCGSAEHKCFALARLKDHLLVQFAHAHRLRLPAAQEDAIQPAIRNRAAVENRNALHTLAWRYQIALPVPRNAWPQFCELIRRIAPSEHIQHAIEY